MSETTKHIFNYFLTKNWPRFSNFRFAFLRTMGCERPFEKKFELLQQAIKANDNNRLFSLEREIDSLVYQLYGLTEEEIKIVEGCE